MHLDVKLHPLSGYDKHGMLFNQVLTHTLFTQQLLGVMSSLLILGVGFNVSVRWRVVALEDALVTTIQSFLLAVICASLAISTFARGVDLRKI